jgi:hypothetical protein
MSFFPHTAHHPRKGAAGFALDDDRGRDSRGRYGLCRQKGEMGVHLYAAISTMTGVVRVQ